MNSTVYEQPLSNLSRFAAAESAKPLSGRVCIVTSAPVCCNPRVVKEADALSDAGFKVRVIASQHVPWVVEWDTQLMKGRKWKLDSVKWNGTDGKSKWTRLKSGARQQAFQLFAKATAGEGIAARAYSRLYNELLNKAASEPADFFIAHNAQALPVAAAAARKFGVKFAFDSEDFHTGEFTDTEKSSSVFGLLSKLESAYLPQCAYVSAPSDEIGEALRKRYGIRKPLTLHNVFPWSDRGSLDGELRDRRGETLSLYWYSQIIGLDRGLQDVIRAADLLPTPVQIHLRGNVSEDVKRELMKLAKDSGVAEMLFFHSPVPPAELLSRAAEHDVGLALEQPVNENRNITVTNKLFFYLLAGLSVAATSTDGQTTVMQSCPEAGFIYSPGDYHSLARELQRLIDSPQLLEARKTAALNAARIRWNWESESRDLVSLVTTELLSRREMAVGR